jgi:glycosyltransferase involved in cell wall biosynthesis
MKTIAGVGRVAAVIPAYNPGTILGTVAASAARELDADSVFVIDDGATDGSTDYAREERVHVITHAVNRGKGAALRTGFAAALAAGADWVFTLDADGQHDPGEMRGFLAAAGRGRFQVLVGSRMADTRDMPWLRRFANRATSFVVSLLAGQRIADSQSGYRLIAAPVLSALDLRYDRFEAESEILVKAGRAGFRIGDVPIRTIYGEERSNIRPLHDTVRFVGLVARLAPVAFGLEPPRRVAAKGTRDP